MSSYTRRRRIATEKRYGHAAANRYEIHRPTVSGVAIGPALAQVDGRLVDAAGLAGVAPGTVVSLQNVASAGRALYMPRVGGTGGGRRSASAGAPSTGPGGGLAPHALDGPYHTGTLARWQAPWAAATTDLHDRQHDIIEPADHIAPTGTPGDIVGVIAGPAVGYYESSSNGATSPGAIARFDSNGDLALRYLNAQKITNDLGSLILDASVEILLDQVLKATTNIGGAPSLLLDPVTGLGDFTILQSEQAYFETIIAAAKRAEAGAVHVTKSLAEVAQGMIVPVAGTGATPGTAGELIVNDFESLPGWDPIGGGRDDHLVKLHFFSAGGTNITPVRRNSGKSNSGQGSASGSTHYTLLNFEAQTPGDPSTVLGYSGGGNNTTVASDSDPALIELDNGNRAIFYDAGVSNAHLHYTGAAQSAIESETGIVFTGRFKRTGSGEGIGLLVADRYPTDNADEYVRIRCYSASGSNATLHVSDHGQSVTPTGITDSLYNPAKGQWHRFRIEFDDEETTAGTTTLRAKFWADGSSEPANWMIDCEYTGAGRPTAGTVGVWFYNDSQGVWYDDLQIDSRSGTSSSNASAAVPVPNGTQDDDYLLAFVITESHATVTKPSEFTLDTTITSLGFSLRVYYCQWSNGDPTEFTWSSDEPEELQAAIYGFRNVTSVPSINGVARAGSEEPNPVTTHAADVGDMDFVFHVRTDAADLAGLSDPANYTRGGYHTAESTEMVAHWRGITVAGNYLPGFTADLGDYIAIHVELEAAAGTSSAFAIGYAAGIVERAADQSALEDGQTRYDFYTLPNQPNSEGRTVPPGSIALDYGTGPLADKSADSYIEITTLDQAGSPYIRFMRLRTWEDPTKWYDGTAWNPNTASIYARRIMQLGELRGLSGFDNAGELGLTVDSNDGRRQNITDQRVEFDGPDVTMRDAGEDFLTIDRDDGIRILSNVTGVREYQRGYSFVDDAGEEIGGVYGYQASGGSRTVDLEVQADDGDDAYLDLRADSGDGAGDRGQINLTAIGGNGSGSGFSTINLWSRHVNASDEPLMDVLSDNVRFNLAGYFRVLDAEEIDLEATGDIALTAAGVTIDADEINDWAGAGTLQAGYTYGRTVKAKKIGDLVFLTGRITRGDSSWTNGQTILTLEVQYRPAVVHYYTVRLGTVGMNIAINTNGTITSEETKTNSAPLVLDGIILTTVTP